MKNQKIQIVVAAVIFAAAGYFVFRFLTAPRSGVQDMSQAAFFVCKNQDCGQDFVMELSEVVKYRSSGNPVPCPHCGKQLTKRAQKCPSPDCGAHNESVGHDQPPEFCAKCGGRMVPLPEPEP